MRKENTTKKENYRLISIKTSDRKILNIIKLNPSIYKKGDTSWPSGVYPRNASSFNIPESMSITISAHISALDTDKAFE